MRRAILLKRLVPTRLAAAAAGAALRCATTNHTVVHAHAAQLKLTLAQVPHKVSSLRTPSPLIRQGCRQLRCAGAGGASQCVVGALLRARRVSAAQTHTSLLLWWALLKPCCVTAGSRMQGRECAISQQGSKRSKKWSVELCKRSGV